MKPQKPIFMRFKNIIAVLALMLVSAGLSAQGIAFLPEGATFSQAVEFAQRDGRMIFLDCYTSWCGPCKMMARDIFPQKEVGDFMNPQFVCIKIDMEKGEGPELAKKLDITSYPTFVIFTSEGNEIGRWAGGADAAGFLQKVKANSIDKGTGTMDERFANGERDTQFLYEYLDALGANYKRAQASEVAEALLEGKEETFASDARLCKAFMSYVQNPFSPAFVYTAKNPDALSNAVGNDAVSAKLASVWMNYPRTLIDEKNGEVSMNEEKWGEFVKLMEECNVPNRESIRLNTLMTYTQKRKDWPAYVGYLKEYYENKSLDMNDLELCKACTPIVAECQDAALRSDVKAILQDRLAKLNSGEREPLRKIGNMTISGNMGKAMEMLIGRL
jgi:thioredoxin-related protein